MSLLPEAIFLPEAISWALLTLYVYLILVYATVGALVMLAVGENARRARQERHENQEVLSRSRQTIPVIILAPVCNEAVVVAASVRSMLALEYPEHEVIVVNDGSRDGTLHELVRVFDLRRRDVPCRHVFDTQAVRGIYESEKYPNLRVIDKEHGGKSDALNSGVNFARYRYICTVDGDTVLMPDALIEGMRLALRDPTRVVGVTSQVAVHRIPEAVQTGQMTARTRDTTLTRFQQLHHLRSFINTRVTWSRLNFVLCAAGAFAIWRRDVVESVGGFSNDVSSEDIELTFRVHAHFRRRKRPYRILSLARIVGRTEGPDSLGALVSQATRAHRGIIETLWRHRRMFLNPTYGAVGMIGMPYYLLTEVLAPFFLVGALVTVPLAWWVGLLTPTQILLFLLVVSLSNGILTNVALVMHDRAGRFHSLGDLWRLVLLGPLEVLLYRPILFWAQARGTIGFLRGDKRWRRFDRNRRNATI